MEFEGKERLVEPLRDAAIVLPKTESEQRRLECRSCLVERPPQLLLERLRGFLERSRARPDRLAVDVRQSEAGLDPDRERIVCYLRIAQPEVE